MFKKYIFKFKKFFNLSLNLDLLFNARASKILSIK